jgi:ABC-2 type transport system ATP-binding protein
LPHAVQTENLTKQYINPASGGIVTAVQQLSIEVEEGEIFGFLGPNGAGKTTTIKMLLGLLFPTEGKASVLGRPAGDLEMRHYISYLPENPYFYDHQTAQEILDFYGRLFNIPAAMRKARIEQLLDLVGLAKVGRKRLNQYSKGMMQRIGIAQALLNDPKLLFFDEPTSGLDPLAHIEIRELIFKIKERGKTMFLSSHQMDDVEKVCDRVAIIYGGKLQVQGKLSDLLVGARMRVTASNVTGGLLMRLQNMGLSPEGHNGSVSFLAESSEVNPLVDALRKDGAQIVEIKRERKSMEDLFVATIREAQNQ